MDWCKKYNFTSGLPKKQSVYSYFIYLNINCIDSELHTGVQGIILRAPSTLITSPFM